MRFTSIASGSSGNCTYIGSNNTHILVDVGISKKRIEEGLNKLDLSFSDISGIFVTHEHSDHIAAIRTILKKHDIPVYATGGTIQGIMESDKKGEIRGAEFVQVSVDSPVTVGDLTIDPMRISHDAYEPCGYRIYCDGRKVGVATDLGCYDDYTVDALTGCDALLLEANHDIRMLQTGPYPYMLKNISDPPAVLYYKGDLFSCNLDKTVAFVGSRRASFSGKESGKGKGKHFIGAVAAEYLAFLYPAGF